MANTNTQCFLTGKIFYHSDLFYMNIAGCTRKPISYIPTEILSK